MVKFQIQPDSEISASNQLFNQIRFAIASRQFPPNHRLPSTRALAMQTGLHRNTVNKVYRQLEELGLVESQAGSGIYVRDLGREGGTRPHSPLLQKYPQAYDIIKDSLDQLLEQGCSLQDARELFLAEIDWRLRCSARVLVTAPSQDIGVGHLMGQEVQKMLAIPVQVVPLEELEPALNQTTSSTVVTSRYFVAAAEKIASPKSVRVIPVDLYDYAKETELVLSLPENTRLGLVSLSSGILRAAEVILHSLRGDNLLPMFAQTEDSYKLNAVVRGADIIICDRASYEEVQTALASNRSEMIRIPEILCCENYISSDSMKELRRELGLE